VDDSTLPDEAVGMSHRGRELAVTHFNHVEQQVALATTTAGLIVAADALIIAVYLTVVRDLQIFAKLAGSLTGIVFAIGGALFIVGLLFALAAAFPNIRAGWFQMDVDNLFFFGTIARLPFSDYSRHFIAHDRAQTLDMELLSQVWAKSRWLVRMFRFLQVAIGCTVAGTILTVVIGTIVVLPTRG